MAPALPFLLLLACGDAPDATIPMDTSADADTDSDTDTDTDADTDTAPVDLDGDGFPAGEDCDDADRETFPGATETWNDEDDDCDGVIDADGAWSGDIAMAASAIYEGRRYDFTLRCPYAGTRALGVLDFTITCTPDPSDENAQRLLGATLTVTPDDRDVTGDRWEDTVIFTSANGWDSRGYGVIAWSSFDAAEVSVEMGGVSLAASGGGAIERE